MHPGPCVLHRQQSYHCASSKALCPEFLHLIWFPVGKVCQANPTLFVATILVVLQLFIGGVMSFHQGASTQAVV